MHKASEGRTATEAVDIWEVSYTIYIYIHTYTVINMIHSWSFMVLANCFSDLPRGMILQRIEPWIEASSGLASSWQLPGTGHVKCGLVWRLRTPNSADYQQMLILTVVKRIEMVVFGCIMIIHDICIHTHIYIYIYVCMYIYSNFGIDTMLLSSFPLFRPRDFGWV